MMSFGLRISDAVYEILLTKEAQKDYQKLAKSVARRINQCLDNLRENPLQYPQAIPLKGKLGSKYGRANCNRPTNHSQKQSL